MATVTLKYTTLNSSIQVGDHVFFTTLATSGAYKVNNSISETYGDHYIGDVKSINLTASPNEVVVNIANYNADTSVLPFATDYFYFVKDNNVNDSGVLGYYSKVKIENDREDKAELYSVGTELFQSSK